MIANAQRPGTLPPGDTPVRFRPTVNGRASLPVELLRDDKVSRAYLPIALALDYLSDGADVVADNETIAEVCHCHTRTVQMALVDLSDSGWIVRLSAGGKSRRRIVLRWKLPDDFRDLMPATIPVPAGAGPARGGVAQLDLFPDARGGGADTW